MKREEKRTQKRRNETREQRKRFSEKNEIRHFLLSLSHMKGKRKGQYLAKLHTIEALSTLGARTRMGTEAEGERER